MSIQIPCPKCGRELKLPDRSLLGRKGKCPKCGHTFVLEEPAAITLELANPESFSAGAKAMTDVRSAPAFLSTTPVTNFGASTPGPVVSGEFAELENVAKPKGTSARLKELQKKNARRRNIGLAIAALVVVAIGCVVMFAPQSAAKNRPADSKNEEVASTESSAVTDGGRHGDGPDPTATDYAKLGSPTKGQAIELQFIPFGTQVVINLHPAELWKSMSLGEEIRYCVPPLAKFIESTLNDLFKRKPEQVEELLICLIPGVRGTMPDIAAVAHMVDEQKRSQLVEQFGQRVDTYGQPVYVSGERAYMIADQKTLVVCPKGQALEMVQAISERHPSEQIDPLLPMTDRDRHVTVVFTPITLSLQESWFPENFRPFVKSAVEWLGDETETMAWSFHLTDEMFYSEIILRNKRIPPKVFERDIQNKLTKLAGKLVTLIGQMNPKEQGKRMVIGRVPAMVEVFSMATIVKDGPHYVQLITPLPDRAAANMVLGSLLAWDESTRTDFSKAIKVAPTEGARVPALVADRLKMKIDVDFRAMPLNEAFTFIGGEIKTPIEIDGDGLKAGGFTKNIKQEFRMDAARAQDVVIKIFESSKGVDANPEKNLVLVVDEAKKEILVTTTASAGRKGLTPFVMTK
jgi:hypothetical protein